MGLSREQIHRIATSAHLDTRGLSQKDKAAVYNHRRHLKTRGAHDPDRKLLLSVRIKANVVGRIHRLTNEAIAVGKWPYKTTSDTVTDLLIRGLTTLKGDETVDEMLPYLEMTQSLARSEAHRRDMQALLLKIRNEISELLGVGASQEALACYGHTMEDIEKMTETVWTNWLMKELRTAFPEMEKYYRKGGEMPTTVRFYRKRKYKLTMDDDHEEQQARAKKRRGREIDRMLNHEFFGSNGTE